MKHLMPVVVAIALNLCVARATQDSTFDVTRLSPKGRAAYQKLFSAPVFSVGGVGLGGETSKEELALYDLLNEADHVTALKSLVRDASFEGGLYGLIGLSITNVAEFNRAVEVYKARKDRPKSTSTEPFSGIKVSRDEVVIQFGCIISADDRGKLVASIQSGRFDKMLHRAKH